jgi:hypothetical protein
MGLLDDIIKMATRVMSPQAIDEAVSIARNPASRETIAVISPDDFINLAREGYSSEKMRNLPMPNLGDPKWSSMPFLQFTNENGVGQVIGHEGRHRARYMRQLGMDKMPIRLLSSGGSGPAIRWGKASDQGFDYIDPSKIPSALINEDKTRIYRMPNSVVYPVQIRERADIPVGGKRYRYVKPMTEAEREFEREMSILDAIIRDFE